MSIERLTPARPWHLEGSFCLTNTPAPLEIVELADLGDLWCRRCFPAGPFPACSTCERLLTECVCDSNR